MIAFLRLAEIWRCSTIIAGSGCSSFRSSRAADDVAHACACARSAVFLRAAEAAGAELELVEEHPANVLRRAELEAAPRQPVRVLLELLLLRRHRRDGGAHGGRVDAEAAQLHPREARDERHFLRGVRPVEALAAQPLLDRRRARVRQRRRLAAQVPRGAARASEALLPRCRVLLRERTRREVFAVGAERAGRVDHPRADERVAELAAHGDAPREEERELVLEVVPHLL